MVGTPIATRAGSRNAAGRFIRSQATIAAEIAALQMRARLEREVPAAEHARGVVYERGHYHKLPGYHPPVSDNGEGERVVETLFDVARAA